MEENVDLCVVDLQHNAIKRPTPFPKKTFLLSEKHISPEHMWGQRDSIPYQSQTILETEVDTFQRNK